MAENEVQANEQAQQTAFGRDDVATMIEQALTEQAEKFKGEISGLNRRNSDLEKLLQEKDKAVEQTKRDGMTELEKLQADLEQERAERQRWQRETKTKENRMKAMEEVSKLGLPTESVDLLNLGDDEAMSAGIERLKLMNEKLKAQFADEYARGNGSGAPKAGGSIGPKTKKRSDMTMAEAMAYKQEYGQEAYAALPK